jgi:hypothetical protein
VGTNSALLSDYILYCSILESYMVVQPVINFVRSAVLYTSLSGQLTHKLEWPSLFYPKCPSKTYP